jgi:hypothetical protein
LPAPKWTALAQSSSVPVAKVCGKLVAPSPPKPASVVADGLIRDPTDGPVFGERIERYAHGDAAKEFVATQRTVAVCKWTESGTHWSETVLTPPKLGDEARLTLILNLDRPDSFNYEMAVRSGDVVLHAVLNSRTAAQDFATQLLDTAWAKAQHARIVNG